MVPGLEALGGHHPSRRHPGPALPRSRLTPAIPNSRPDPSSQPPDPRTRHHLPTLTPGLHVLASPPIPGLPNRELASWPARTGSPDLGLGDRSRLGWIPVSGDPSLTRDPDQGGRIPDPRLPVRGGGADSRPRPQPGLGPGQARRGREQPGSGPGEIGLGQEQPES